MWLKNITIKIYHEFTVDEIRTSMINDRRFIYIFLSYANDTKRVSLVTNKVIVFEL